FCYFHDRMNERMPAPALPPLEDHESVQLALMQVAEQLWAGKIEVKTANAMTYILQTAAANLRRANFTYVSASIVTEDPVHEHAHAKRAAAAPSRASRTPAERPARDAASTTTS